MPFFGAVRAAKRRLWPYESDPGNDAGLLESVLEQMKTLEELGQGIEGRTVLEIGTGWLPVLPLLYRMANAERVITVDLEPLADRRTLGHALRLIDDFLPQAAARAGIDLANFRRDTIVFDPRSTLQRTLAANGIDYRVPFDAERMEANAADIVVSRTVFEHVPPPRLRSLLKRLRTVLKPGGVMIHEINMGDHFYMYDRSISPLNFLRYEDSAWRWTHACNQLYMNRLRRFEFLEMFAEAGFRILSASAITNEAAQESIRSMQVCSRYRHLPADELSILNTTIVAV
jgi:SAM-dependent methyltransferase